MEQITNRESQVKELMDKGYSVNEIGRALNIFPATVKFHKSNIYRKYGRPEKIKKPAKPRKPRMTTRKINYYISCYTNRKLFFNASYINLNQAIDLILNKKLVVIHNVTKKDETEKTLVRWLNCGHTIQEVQQRLEEVNKKWQKPVI